jgi:UDP-perosamine 4-acetyltransferase
MDKIVVIGGGGHAKVIIDLLQALGSFGIIGVLDFALKKGETLLDLPVLGGDEILDSLLHKGIDSVAIGIGGVRDTVHRKEKYLELKKLGFKVPTLVHPFSHISPHASLADGVQVIAGSVVQPCALIGENTLINTRVVVGHDCKIGKHVHLAPGVVLGGEVTIEDDVFVGSGTKILQGISVCCGVCIGAGTVVVRNITEPGTFAGVPARRIK